MNRKYAASTLIALISVGSLLSSSSTAAASDDPYRTARACADLQREVDDWVAGRVFYFSDPRPDWLKEAQDSNCTIRNLEPPLSANESRFAVTVRDASVNGT